METAIEQACASTAAIFTQLVAKYHALTSSSPSRPVRYRREIYHFSKSLSAELGLFDKFWWLVQSTDISID